MSWGRKVKLGKSQAWDFIKNDWSIKDMTLFYNIGGSPTPNLSDDEAVKITFELTNILQKTIDNYWMTKEREDYVAEALVEEQCFLNLSRDFEGAMKLSQTVTPLIFGSDKTKRKIKRKRLASREAGRREWEEWMSREENQEGYYDEKL
jgi:hypothetical protein